MEYVEINDVIGKTFSDITVGTDEIIFTTLDGDKYEMFHRQDCCETVEVEDIIGDINDLIGVPIIIAEEVTNREDDMGVGSMESFTWTFYKLSTIKGYVTIRWLGYSSGYYSESVSLCKLKK